MRTVIERTLLVVLLYAFSGMSQAEVTTFPDGDYSTLGQSHYKDGTVNLSAWGNGYTMKAVLVDFGREYETEAFLEPSGPNQFSGSGFITVRYTPNTGCQHRFGVKIFVAEAGLFLRENTPQTIPYDPFGPCTVAGPYVWFNHERPYNLN